MPFFVYIVENPDGRFYIGQTTYYFYDDQKVFAEYDDSGTLLRYYVDGADYIDEHAVVSLPDADGDDTDEDFYYLLGPLYSVVGLVDPNGNLVEATWYDAYGFPHTTRRPDNPSVYEAGSRYFDVVPADGEDAIALLVTGENPTELTCIQLYVQDDNSATTGYNEFGTVGATPVFMTPAEWIAASADERIHVRGEEIRPSFCRPGNNCNQLGLAVLDPARYVVQAVAASGAGGLYSDPSVVVQTWARGDTDGNEVCDFNDIYRINSEAFMGIFGGGTPPLTHEMADLIGADFAPMTFCEPQGPDKVIDFRDTAEVVRAFVDDTDFCDDESDDPVTDPALDPCATSPSSPSVPEVRPGNQYYFTGRRLDIDLRDTDGSLTGTVGTPLVVLAHHRARAYNLLHGRWMQRDPAEYVDGMNLYEYVMSVITTSVDPSGEWGRDVHFDRTKSWAEEVGYREECATRIAQHDEEVDSYTGGSSPMYWVGDFRYHFDTNKEGTELQPGARRQMVREELARAYKSVDGAVHTMKLLIGLQHFGRAMHPLQDDYAHIASHDAATPFDHSPYEQCTASGDPYGILIPWCVVARLNNPNWGDYARPDRVTLWPADLAEAENETKAEMREFLKENAIDCYCRE